VLWVHTYHTYLVIVEILGGYPLWSSLLVEVSMSYCLTEEVAMVQRCGVKVAEVRETAGTRVRA
jgi:hypothetical protein